MTPAFIGPPPSATGIRCLAAHLERAESGTGLRWDRHTEHATHWPHGLVLMAIAGALLWLGIG